MYELFACEYGYTPNEFFSLTHDQAMIAWHYMHNRQRDSYRGQAALHGLKLKDDARDALPAVSAAEAKKVTEGLNEIRQRIILQKSEQALTRGR